MVRKKQKFSEDSSVCRFVSSSMLEGSSNLNIEPVTPPVGNKGPCDHVMGPERPPVENNGHFISNVASTSNTIFFENIQRRKRNNDLIINLDDNDDLLSDIDSISSNKVAGKSRDRMQRYVSNLSDEKLQLRKEQSRNIHKTLYWNRKEIINSPYYLKGYEYENIEYFLLSPFDQKCEFCYANHFIEERPKSCNNVNRYYDCCNYGKFINLMDLIDEYPSELKSLFFKNSTYYENNEAISYENFIGNIRKFNCSFSCASLACFKFKFPSGPPIFKIYGQTYHKYNNIAMTDSNDIPTNGQLYFVDSGQALNLRSNALPECNNELLAHIETILRDKYPYAKAYKMMNEVSNEYNSTGSNILIVPEVKLLFSLKKDVDPRRYNLPRVDEIYAIIVCNADDEVPPANIVVHLKGSKEIKNIYPLDPNVEPMTYPLFYPNKTKGWSYSITDLNGKKISLCDFVRFRLFYREDGNGKFLPHHYAKKLFQQYVVDQCARIEWDRLNFIRHHQKEIRKSSYKGLEEFLASKAEKLDADVGKQIILPSTFSGGPRSMHEHFMDAMAIINKVGKPDLFITYTCNPKDPDILKCLLPGQVANDRPDIVARVFKLKVDEMLHEIKSGLFGKVLGYCYVIEFQKRGLPHMHLLITLDPEHKLRNKDQIDKLISAEIPDKNKDLELYSIVTRFMLHGPCNSKSPCWNNDKKCCDKKFPHKFREETELNEDGYPHYKRPNNGRHHYIKGIPLTNEYVVPYNRYLLKRFNAHINMEKVSDIKAVKYLYKYIYKGYDSACVECVIQEADGSHKLLKYDEVANYLDARCIGPVEACWRIFKFPLQQKSHSIERLEIHLENEQEISHEIGADLNVIKNKINRDTKLTGYFKYNQENPDKKYLYPDMPIYCTWDDKISKWKDRKGFGSKFGTLGRIYSISPRDTEKYYLRYLLLNVSANSFMDLKTFNGIEYETFAQAALARGLCRDDEEWKCCLQEASRFKFPRALRTLFSNILIHGDPKYPDLLWNEFKDDLSHDLKRIYKNAEKAYQQTLFLINKSLSYQDKSLADYKSMPQLLGSEDRINEDDIFDPAVELKKANAYIDKMYDEQKSIIEEIYSFLENNTKQKLIYIDGPGGTGKSFTLLAIYHLLKSYKKKVCNMAFSGIAATILKGGRTVHNRFKLPLNLNKDSRSGIQANTKDANEIKNSDFFNWDEAPMAPKYALDTIDLKLKDLMKNNEPFGGKSIILSGDFRQLPPIKEHATRSEIVDLTIKKSHLWDLFKVFHLTKNMRADPNEKIFAETLLDIGNGVEDYIKVPDSCICSDDLVEKIFGDIFESNNYSELPHRGIVAPYNVDVSNYNMIGMDKFPGIENVSLSIDESDPQTDFYVDIEILNSVQCTSLPDHKLILKNNCPVMLIRNLNVEQSQCNGTRLQVLNIDKHVLRCIILGGDKAGEVCFIPRISLIEDKKFPFIIKRHQFPIKPAFAFTINKSQAQTFKKIGIDLTKDVFIHGQTYVAFSRAKSWSGIKVKLAPDNVECRVKNIVWKEILM